MGDPGGTRAVSRHGGCPRAAEGTLNGRISHRLTSLTPPLSVRCRPPSPPRHGPLCPASRQLRGSVSLPQARLTPAPGTAVPLLFVPFPQRRKRFLLPWRFQWQFAAGRQRARLWLESKLVPCLNADVWHRLMRGHGKGSWGAGAGWEPGWQRQLSQPLPCAC